MGNNISVISTHLQNWNTGLMTAIQINPDGSDTSCADAITECNLAINDLLDFASYTASGQFNFFEAFDNLNVFNIKAIEENTACGYDRYLEAIDGMCSNWDKLAGAGANAVTDVVWWAIEVYANGKSSFETPLVKAWTTYMIPAFQTGGDPDYALFGEGFALFFSQLVKFENGQDVFGVSTI